jgi:TatD family-associated radical SAM protein
MNGALVYYLPCKPGSLYINVTDRCLNGCLFCIKRDGSKFYGCDLSLHGIEPTAPNITQSLAANAAWESIREIVVCGMGEPLLRYDCVWEVCDWIKRQKGGAASIRVDTSGLFWYQTKLLDLLECIDVLSISLNAETAEKYEELCQPKITGAYAILFDFLKAVKAWENEQRRSRLPFPQIRLSVVDTSEEEFLPPSGRRGYPSGSFPVPDFDKCREIADKFGWPLIIKRLFRDSRDDRWTDRELLEMCAKGISPEVCRDCAFRH